MPDPDRHQEALAKLEARLERCRKTQLEAEAIAEKALRHLYLKQTELAEQTKITGLLQEIAVAANESFNIEEVLQFALDRICIHTRWPVGHVYTLAENDAGKLVSTAVWHLANEARFETFRQATEQSGFAPDIGLPGLVLATGKPVWVGDVTQDPSFSRNEVAKGAGLKTGFGFPILTGNEVVGVLEFYSEDAIEPDPQMMEVMGHIGTQLGRVTERERAKREHARLATFPEENPNPVIEIETSGKITYINPAATEKFPDLRTLGLEHPVLEGVMSAAAKLWPQKVRLTVREVTLHGRTLEQQISTSIFNKLIRIYMSDITERKRAEEMIQHQAYHDSLTALPNRLLFSDRLNQATSRAHWNKRLGAVLYLDLDNFKHINDTLGHRLGNLLLKIVAQKLTHCLRDGDTVARLGGDEFAVILVDIAQIQDVAQIAQKILDMFSKPIPVEDHDLFITPSIGISLYPNDGNNSETLLRNADIAMYRSKEQGKNRFHFFLPEMNAKISERQALETALRRAVDQEDFLLYYQPLVDLRSGGIIGMEALIRWKDQKLGMVSPARFIPLAEDTGLILPIGEWVLNTACRQIKEWQKGGFPRLRMAVNLSARQFHQQNLIEMIKGALRHSALDASSLELELTESMVMKKEESTIETLRELHAMGVQLSIDDFGTGYSSLSYLKRFPIHILKIDQSFVRDLTTDPEDVAIAKAIITLAHNLNLTTTAEAVETQGQLEILRSLKCDHIQGYYFSPPLPVQEATQLLLQNKRL